MERQVGADRAAEEEDERTRRRGRERRSRVIAGRPPTPPRAAGVPTPRALPSERRNLLAGRRIALVCPAEPPDGRLSLSDRYRFRMHGLAVRERIVINLPALSRRDIVFFISGLICNCWGTITSLRVFVWHY